MPSYILSKCELSLHCGWACAFSDVLLGQMTCCIGHKRMPSLCCRLPCVFWDFLLDQMTYYIPNRCASFTLLRWPYESTFSLACRGLTHSAEWYSMNKTNFTLHLLTLIWRLNFYFYFFKVPIKLLKLTRTMIVMILMPFNILWHCSVIMLKWALSSSSCVVSYNMHVTSNEVTTPDD